MLDTFEEKGRLLAENLELGQVRPDIAENLLYLPVERYLMLYREILGVRDIGYAAVERVVGDAMWRWINPHNQTLLPGRPGAGPVWGMDPGMRMGRARYPAGQSQYYWVSSYADGLRKIDALDTYRKKWGYIATDWTSQITTTGDSQFGQKKNKR